jgi:hypothetical protein
MAETETMTSRRTSRLAKRFFDRMSDLPAIEQIGRARVAVRIIPSLEHTMAFLEFSQSHKDLLAGGANNTPIVDIDDAAETAWGLSVRELFGDGLCSNFYKEQENG